MQTGMHALSEPIGAEYGKVKDFNFQHSTLRNNTTTQHNTNANINKIIRASSVILSFRILSV
jgi:hypothetical protein